MYKTIWTCNASVEKIEKELLIRIQFMLLFLKQNKTEQKRLVRVEKYLKAFFGKYMRSWTSVNHFLTKNTLVMIK